ncbi:MAG TPA: transcription-repair coupling factor [Clostridiales bacterium]|nr:transcription-repair coupling factor [Clostridiales bacterium]HPV02046.1 transcription-repair coupling factor [Clostridiales bacterium]
MLNFIEPLLELEEYSRLLAAVREHARPVTVIGPSESQKAHISYALCRHCGKKGVFVAFNEMQARRLFEDFSFFIGDDAVFFPAKEIMLYDVEAKSYDTVYQRLSALDRICRGDYSFVVTSVEAVSHKLLHPDKLMRNVITVGNHGRLDPDKLIRTLVVSAYERMEFVEKKGQFAVRGGIVDVFPINADNPVRIEFFGDEIDSLRWFDVNTQRSVGHVESIRILPAREMIFDDAERAKVIRTVKQDAEKAGRRNQELISKINADMERLEESWYFPGIDRYIPYIIDEPCTLADYLGDDAIIFMDEPARQQQRLENLLLEHEELCKALIEKGSLLPECTGMFFDYESVFSAVSARKPVYMNTVNADGISAKDSLQYSIPCRTIGSFQGSMDILRENLIAWKRGKSRVLLLSGTRGRGERLRDSLSEKGIESVYMDEVSRPVMPGEVVITRGSLHKGFEYLTIGFVVISDDEIFGRDRRKTAKSRGKYNGRPISVFTDLAVGDYVVHQTHGIGQYVGLEKLTVEGVKKDYLKIRYQEGAFLYIPTNQMDLIQKYIGTEGKQPKINKLGGSDWLKTRTKVKESLKKLAEELIKLYAQRAALKGFQYSKDTVWQKQFEEQFPYEETEDQLRCIEEIKRDMESGKVMDRLLCGDVGFGKTEVAIRAVFKAVMDGRQVAWLVPTTVLAQQHYSNFLERMKDFPVTVEMLSRFRSRAEQKRILRDVKSGKVDVLIGTHRLLQKDIQFRDLGLLVIDEEQRFGVSHKERLKNLSPEVDVLTLTATPIPRTLHMSLTGIRDISVIEDPPEERYPVQTYVMEYNRDVIRDAIMRELARQGQVFYLYNRVRTIEAKAAEVQAMVPDARVGVAHGQMDEAQLEDIMMSFLKGEFDILVCTTIIESGLDMPNVNTIIVEDADKMGLAQLYQLRGRVGRSNRLAYAYITYRKDKVISEVAEKRLQAIKEFTELGSGFRIAMRDMEIRGAGNLLGPEQHGHMEAVGYEMYCRLLDEAVRELRGEPARKEDVEVTIDINIDAYIDDSYIGNESRKIEMYRKIAAINDENDVIDIEDELIDRYGEIPEPVRNLIKVAHIRALARSLGISSVTEKKDSVIFAFADSKSIDFRAIAKTAEKYRRQLLFSAGTSPHLVYKKPQVSGEKLADNIKILLQDLKSYDTG